MDSDELTGRHREFLKDSVRLWFDFSTTAQSRGEPPPPAQKPHPAGAGTVALPGPELFGDLGAASLLSLLKCRRSVRRFTEERFSLTELAFCPGPARA